MENNNKYFLLKKIEEQVWNMWEYNDKDWWAWRLCDVYKSSNIHKGKWNNCQNGEEAERQIQIFRVLFIILSIVQLIS